MAFLGIVTGAIAIGKSLGIFGGGGTGATDADRRAAIDRWATDAANNGPSSTGWNALRCVGNFENDAASHAAVVAGGWPDLKAGTDPTAVSCHSTNPAVEGYARTKLADAQAQWQAKQKPLVSLGLSGSGGSVWPLVAAAVAVVVVIVLLTRKGR